MTDFEALRLPALTGVDQAVHQYEECGIIDGIPHDSICSAPLLKVRDEMPVAACPLRTEHPSMISNARMRKRTHTSIFARAFSYQVFRTRLFKRFFRFTRIRRYASSQKLACV